MFKIDRQIICGLLGLLLFTGCASQGKRTTRQEPPPDNEERQIAEKYALWTTPQLERRREALGVDLNPSLAVFGPFALPRLIDYKEIGQELNRRAAEAKAAGKKL